MDTIKNFVYAGVGLASQTADKVKEHIEDLVEKGKISDSEGSRIIADFLDSTESKREEFESKLKSFGDKITSKFDTGKNEDEVSALKKRIEELEAKLADATKKPAAKKATKSSTKKD